MQTRSMTKKVPATPEHQRPGSPTGSNAATTPEGTNGPVSAYQPITPKSPDLDTGDVLVKHEGTVGVEDPFVQQHPAASETTKTLKLDGPVLSPVTQLIDHLNTTAERADQPDTPKRGWDDVATSLQDSNTKRQRLTLIEGLEDYIHFAHGDPRDRNFTEREIWSDRRQGLCESLPWYKSYKGSLHTAIKVPLGMLLDGLDRPQDVLQAQVIITTVGGGRVQLKKRADSNSAEDESAEYESAEAAIAQGEGSMVTRKTHQNENSTDVQSLKNGLKLGSYVGVVVGNHLRAFKDQPARYSVLDFFIVTDVWCEKAAFKKFSDSQDTKICREFCVRLEKVNLETVSWWDKTPANYAPLDQPYNNQLCATMVCDSCSIESKHILNEGWTCLTPKCSKHFLDQEGKVILNGTYNQQFLAERTSLEHRRNKTNVPSIFPEVPQPTADSHGTEACFRQGRVCEKCGCCSRRRQWLQWECENRACDWTHAMLLKEYPAGLLAYEEEMFHAKFARSKAMVDKRLLANQKLANSFALELDVNIHHRAVILGPYTVFQFLLPSPTGEIIGSVSIFRANPDIRARGVDEMFRELSTHDIGLRRNAVSCKDTPNEGLSRNFGQNFGAFYKFGVNVQSKGFSEAPDVVLKATQRLKWAQENAFQLAKEWIDSLGVDASEVDDWTLPFNECLVLAYMEADAINYHDDGEKDVGSTIATFSAGSPAVMSFRPKRKVWFSPEVLEARTFSVETIEELVRQKRRSLGLKVEEKKREKPLTAEQKDFLDKHVDLKKLLALQAGKEGLTWDYRNTVSYPLESGDILVMQGREIHRSYEHKVDPYGMRRYALTVRHIMEDHLTAEQRQDRLVKGEIPARAAAFVYDGDKDLPPAVLPPAVITPAGDAA